MGNEENELVEFFTRVMGRGRRIRVTTQIVGMFCYLRLIQKRDNWEITVQQHSSLAIFFIIYPSTI